MMRMSTGTGRVPPTRSMMRSWIARRSFACSRTSVPEIPSSSTGPPGDRGAGIGAGAAGDDRDVDALGLQVLDQAADVDGDVDHHQIGAAAGTQNLERLLRALGVGDGRPFVHGELGRQGQLAMKRADDQQTHGRSPFIYWARIAVRAV